jgi:ribosomal protein S18 acetylase RimI-like enzyme
VSGVAGILTVTMQLEFREVRLVDLWRHSRPGEPVPAEVLSLRSWECLLDTRAVGHCTGDSASGEIVGLSVLPAYEGQGIGRKLLSLVVDALQASGANRIWLAAPSDPALRAYGFYRAVGWVPTGERTGDGSEILELHSD